MKNHNCANCSQWEPIPFHDDGGVCMAGAGAPSSRESAQDFAKPRPGSVGLPGHGIVGHAVSITLPCSAGLLKHRETDAPERQPEVLAR